MQIFFKRSKMKCYSARDVKENLHRRGIIWAKLPLVNDNFNGGKDGESKSKGMRDLGSLEER